MNLATLESKIFDTMKSVNLHKISFDPEIERCLNLTQDILRSMSAEECGICAYTLKNYALYIQTEMNKYSNIMGWASRNISILLSKEYNNIGDKYTKYEVKRLLLIQNNSAATELYKQYIEVKIKHKTLKEVSRNISFIAETLLALQATKRWQK